MTVPVWTDEVYIWGKREKTVSKNCIKKNVRLKTINKASDLSAFLGEKICTPVYGSKKKRART